MASTFLYVPANKQVSLYAGVSAVIDSDYTDDWLCDGLPGRPIRSTNTSLSATITPLAAGTCSIAAIINHNVSVNATLGADLSGTITAGAIGKNGIYLNPYLTFSPVAGVDSITLTIASNGATVVIGEFIAGEYTSLTLPFYRDHSFKQMDYARAVDMDLSSVRPYDPGLVSRTWSATWPALTTAEKNALLDAYDAQKGKTQPTLVVPDTSVNDAWACFLTAPQWKPSDVPNRWEVSCALEEIPRSRW
jgi:hypothetical protein